MSMNHPRAYPRGGRRGRVRLLLGTAFATVMVAAMALLPSAAHAQTITGVGSLVRQCNDMLEIVEAQMRAAGMGETVTSELATLRDLGTAYITQAVRARAVLERDHFQTISTPAGLANALSGYTQLFDDPELVYTWPERWASVTADEVADYAKRLLTPENRFSLRYEVAPAETAGA